MLIKLTLIENFSTVKECKPIGTDPSSCWSKRDNSLTCQDGKIFMLKDNDTLDKCFNNGGLCKCPATRPIMCSDKTNISENGTAGYWCKRSIDECQNYGGARTCNVPQENTIEINSDSFRPNGVITQTHACVEIGGNELTPPLHIKHPRNNGVKSYSLILEDLDSHINGVNYIHWLIPYIGVKYIDQDVVNEIFIKSQITENKPNLIFEENGRDAIQGKNSYGEYGYKGLCPDTDNFHRYMLSIYALTDSFKECTNCNSKAQLLSNINNSILFTGTTTFLYKRNKT